MATLKLILESTTEMCILNASCSAYGAVVQFCYGGDEPSGNGTPDSSTKETLYLASVVSVCTCSGEGLLRGYHTIEERLYQVLTVEERGIKLHHASSP
jgi:hypothetical protein